MDEAAQHLLGADLPELAAAAIPVGENPRLPFASRALRVIGAQRLERRFPVRAVGALPVDRFAVGAAFEAGVLVEHEGHAAGHAGAEVRADGAEDHRGAAGHIFAAVRAASLDDDLGARVAHRKALARLARREQRARGRAIKDGVADDAVVLAAQRARHGGPHDDAATRQALADLNSEEHTSELPSLMRISYAVFCLKKKQ